MGRARQGLANGTLKEVVRSTFPRWCPWNAVLEELLEKACHTRLSHPAVLKALRSPTKKYFLFCLIHCCPKILYTKSCFSLNTDSTLIGRGELRCLRLMLLRRKKHWISEGIHKDTLRVPGHHLLAPTLLLFYKLWCLWGLSVRGPCDPR